MQLRRGSAHPRGRHRHRWLRRATLGLAVLVVLVVGGGMTLLAVTPSASNAPARVRALARRDGASHVGNPVPPLFAEAIVASENSRFYSDPGFDPIAIARAAWMTVTDPGTDPGGSTLSQQLAKQLYTDRTSNGTVDVVEQVALAVKLNADFSKAKILRMYASTVYFGGGFYGLYDASCGYFGVTPKRLSLAQASLLAGLVQAPSADDPLQHLTRAKRRQRYVLGRLVATGRISQTQARAAADAPLKLGGGEDARRCWPSPNGS